MPGKGTVTQSLKCIVTIGPKAVQCVSGECLPPQGAHPRMDDDCPEAVAMCDESRACRTAAHLHMHQMPSDGLQKT